MSLSITAYGLGAVRDAARLRHLHQAHTPTVGRCAPDHPRVDAARPARSPWRFVAVLAGGVLAAALGIGAAGLADAAQGRFDAQA
jgi:hypothetical protein